MQHILPPKRFEVKGMGCFGLGSWGLGSLFGFVVSNVEAMGGQSTFHQVHVVLSFSCPCTIDSSSTTG